MRERLTFQVVLNSQLHEAFFSDVKRWVALHMASKNRIERTALLRHLLRCVFVWAMKGRIGLDERVFDQDWWSAAGSGTYHHDVMRFLFHHRMNEPAGIRESHKNPVVQAALRDVRFLNGSIFAEQEIDRALTLSDHHYFGHGEDNGLWSIFRQYRWSLQEDAAETRELAIGPRMLGFMFEHLIPVIELDRIDDLLDKMPDGTYYTPVDVVREMSKDAVAERLGRDAIPADWTTDQVRRLFDSDYEAFPIADEKRKALANALARLTVFDPSVGAGEFLLGSLRAIRRGLTNLGMESLAEPRRIVEDQLFAQDINPLAVDVARLRTIIAIEESESNDTSRPLPDVEAKIVCGDTIGTEIRTFGQRHIAETDLSMATDPRRTLGTAVANGFDIVIGNPPYVRAQSQAIGEERLIELRNQAKRNGYRDFDDIYMLFCEASLELSHPINGVVVLVVPLSISFSAKKLHIRNAFTEKCERIYLRHQDNRPDKTFGDSPVKNAESRQRTTIVIGVRGTGECRIYTSGLGRWLNNERSRYFAQRNYVRWQPSRIRTKLNSDLVGQWPRLCTPEAVVIVTEMARRGTIPKWHGAKAIGFPKTARYYVTVAQAGTFDRDESVLSCSERNVESLIAVLNSGIAHLWWKAWDDGFHVKPKLFESMPDIRSLVDRRRLGTLGERIARELVGGKTDTRQSGTAGGRLTENMNLWNNIPDVLNEVDGLLLRGLGIKDVDRFQRALDLERSRTVVPA